MQPHVEQWMREESHRRLDLNAEKINAAGAENLRPIKTDFQALISRIPQLCQASLGPAAGWPHNAKGSSGTMFFFPNTFRRAIYHLRRVLSSHGLGADSGHDDPFAATFDFGVCESTIQYIELERRHYQLSLKLKKKREELAKAQARELWDHV